MLIAMKEEEVNRCQIQNWYPKFKSLTIKTKFHKLPESFINYLIDDSGPFLLPDSVTNEDAMPNRVHNFEEEDDFQVPEESSDNETEPPLNRPSFPELEIEVRESIETLGGIIIPKLNWSAPKDAAWISPSQNLSCTCFNEIALLFRSSDSLIHDLCNAYDSCIDKVSSRPESFYLALRKWYPSLKPEMEFRCFVKSNDLVGICQRENYTFDVYVTKERKVKLIDFNTWCGSTLPLMYTWEELEKIHGECDELELRIVESRLSVLPGLKTAVPYDYLDVSPGSGWDQVLKIAEEEFQKENQSSDEFA
ncbi:cell division cycle protein 123 homolog isoform X2 [Arabidopsis lyrata subsp. lyrata]|uniref:cell division cycle protein 123 homolog isoform X2 n=1 Tax=Arabidopsis lyrata subsp. lyrata TaxID=81972 RepID=UPI000A29A596|nr:cell division cycle protein 123 homolog isoform X2 [Arabidopsis lyrata subsp. lyrata]|eukprot:XP_020876430.1 cell division cycle protein 123 homolog isoform X2 [Arabidopsis lyrata subsp. lyrata]